MNRIPDASRTPFPEAARLDRASLLSPEEPRTHALRASIVIPVYNERDAVAGLLTELVRRGLDKRHEIIVVDDGSTDGTTEAVEAFDTVGLVRHSRNRGYGAALKTGLRRARNEKVVFMDGDGQHSPDGIEEVVRLLDTYPMVIGERGPDSRQDRGRLLGKRLIRVLGEYILDEKLPDYNSGFRGFQRSAILPILGILPSGFSFSTTSTLAFVKQGIEYATIPIHVAPRVGRASTVRLFRDGIRTALLLLRIVMLFHPLKIFFPASCFFGVLGLGWGVVGALVSHRVPNSAVMTVVLGMFLFFIGLLADQISLLHFRSQESWHVRR
jgi:glycosyltransferase involved in cell wall biosynthesis